MKIRNNIVRLLLCTIMILSVCLSSCTTNELVVPIPEEEVITPLVETEIVTPLVPIPEAEVITPIVETKIVTPLVTMPATEILPKGPFVLPAEVENKINLTAPYYLPSADDVAVTWEIMGLIEEEAPFVKMDDMFCRIANATSNSIQLILCSTFSEREIALINEVIINHNILFGVINPQYTINVVCAFEASHSEGNAYIELSLVNEFEDTEEPLLGRTSYASAVGDGVNFTFPNASIELLQNMEEKFFKSIFTHELYHAFGFGHTNYYYDKTSIMAPRHQDFFSSMLSLKDIKALFAAYGDVNNQYAKKLFNDYYEIYAPQYLLDIVNLATAKIGRLDTKSNIENDLSLGNFLNGSTPVNMETGEMGEFTKYDTLYRIVNGKMKIEVYELGDEFASGPPIYSGNVDYRKLSDYAVYEISFSREYDFYIIDNTVILDMGEYYVNGFAWYLCFQRYGTTYIATDLQEKAFWGIVEVDKETV